MNREESKSCICTIKMLQRLAYNIHGVMDIVDADNCEKIIKALEQQPCDDAVSREVYKQVICERDIAIEQLNELGYEFGEKIEPKYCDRNICVSNEYNGIGCEDCEITKSQEHKGILCG